MSGSSTAFFWVFLAPDGAAKIHLAACAHALDGEMTGKRRVKAENKNWSPFETYEAARGFAERTTNLRWVNVDCARCKPDETANDTKVNNDRRAGRAAAAAFPKLGAHPWL